MSRHRRRRPRKSATEAAAAIPLTDPDLVALWPEYGESGRRILQVLQAGRDRQRGTIKPPPPTSTLYDQSDDR